MVKIMSQSWSAAAWYKPPTLVPSSWILVFYFVTGWPMFPLPVIIWWSGKLILQFLKNNVFLNITLCHLVAVLFNSQYIVTFHSFESSAVLLWEPQILHYNYCQVFIVTHVSFMYFIDVGKPCLWSDLALEIINFSQKSTEFSISSLKLRQPCVNCLSKFLFSYNE